MGMLGRRRARRRLSSADAGASGAEAVMARLDSPTHWQIGAEKFGWSPPQWAADLLGIGWSRDVLTVDEMKQAAYTLGQEEGAAAGRGEHHSSRIEDLPGRRLLAAASAQRVCEVKVNAEAVRRELEVTVSEIGDRKKNAKKQSDEIDAKLTKLRVQRDDDDDLPAAPPNRFAAFVSENGAYSFALLVLVGAEIPTIYSALQNTGIEPWASWMLTIALSLVAAFTAHILGGFVYGALKDYRLVRHPRAGREPGESIGAPYSAPVHSEDSKADLIIKVFVSGALFLFFFLSMFEMYKLRLAVLKTAEGQTDDDLSLLLLFLQIVFFMIAFAYSFIRSESDSERDQRKKSAARARSLDREERAIAIMRDEKDAQESHVTAHKESLATLIESLNKTELEEIEKERSLLEEAYRLHDHAYELAEHSGPLRGTRS